MIRMGFHEKWVRLVMLCISSVKYWININGTDVGPIIPERGLRQGDPLSPYLFILCVEGLSSLIRDSERKGELHGCKVANGAPVVSHLFFCR